MRPDILARMLAEIQQQGAMIDSLTLIRNGYLVLEAGQWPYRTDTPHIIHSCTKSVTSALVGIALEKGLISSVRKPVLEFFDYESILNLDQGKKSLCLEDLLTMTTGLACRDSYVHRWRGLGAMMTSQDWVRFMLDLPMVEKPGEWFEYCNGASFLLSAIIQKTARMTTLDFARMHLFKPLGIDRVRWQANPQGITIGWGQLWLEPRDMAKFGWLYLKGGLWAGEQVVPAEWVKASTKGRVEAGTLSERYGYQWWVDSEGYYAAMGFGGQFIFVVPEKNLVAVFTGALSPREFSLPERLLNKYVLPAVAPGPLEARPEDKAKLDSLLVAMESGPEPSPVPDLPQRAVQISGRTYTFEPNRMKLKDMAFTFRPGEKECQAEMTVPKGTYTSAVGLDGRYRISDSDRGSWAYKGSWETADRFAVTYRVLGYTSQGQAVFDFEGEKVKVGITDRSTGAAFEFMGQARD